MFKSLKFSCLYWVLLNLVRHNGHYIHLKILMFKRIPSPAGFQVLNTEFSIDFWKSLIQRQGWIFPTDPGDGDSYLNIKHLSFLWLRNSFLAVLSSSCKMTLTELLLIGWIVGESRKPRSGLLCGGWGLLPKVWAGVSNGEVWLGAKILCLPGLVFSLGFTLWSISMEFKTMFHSPLWWWILK